MRPSSTQRRLEDIKYKVGDGQFRHLMGFTSSAGTALDIFFVGRLGRPALRTQCNLANAAPIKRPGHSVEVGACCADAFRERRHGDYSCVRVPAGSD